MSDMLEVLWDFIDDNIFKIMLLMVMLAAVTGGWYIQDNRKEKAAFYEACVVAGGYPVTMDHEGVCLRPQLIVPLQEEDENAQ